MNDNLARFSQRDPKWASVPLGSSKTTTIGSHGCTITCIGMLANLTPDAVNIRLKGVQGYANTNLVIWSKIQVAIPRLVFEWRGYTYDNDKVADAIAKYGGCLVEVDGAPIGGVRHWVLYVGNKKLYDPWTGTERATSTYKPVGYAVIRVTQTTGTLITQKMIDDIRNERDANHNAFVKVMEALGIEVDLLDKMSSAQHAVNHYVQAKARADRVAELETRLATIDKTHQQEKKEIISQHNRALTIKDAEIAKLNTTIQGVELMEGQYKSTMEALEKKLREAQEETRKLQSENPCPTLWSRIISIFTK